MVTADPTAKWLMQAWLFFDQADFWQPPQVKVSKRFRHVCPASSIDLQWRRQVDIKQAMRGIIFCQMGSVRIIPKDS